MDRRIKKSYTKRSYKSTFYDSQQEISASIFLNLPNTRKESSNNLSSHDIFLLFRSSSTNSIIKGHEYSTAIPFPFFHRSKPGSRSS